MFSVKEKDINYRPGAKTQITMNTFDINLPGPDLSA